MDVSIDGLDMVNDLTDPRSVYSIVGPQVRHLIDGGVYPHNFNKLKKTKMLLANISPQLTIQSIV